MSLSGTIQIRMVVSLLVAATIAGSWWYAALKKPGTGIFYWLAAAHTAQVGVSAAYAYGTYVRAAPAFWEQVSGVQSLLGLCVAGIYVALVNWLLERP
jgi:hypothetical protein